MFRTKNDGETTSPIGHRRKTHFLPKSSLRFRLALTYTGLAVFALLLVGLLITFFLQDALNRQFDDRLNARADIIALNINNSQERIGVSNPISEDVGLYQISNLKNEVRGSSAQLTSITKPLSTGQLTLGGLAIRAVERPFLIQGEPFGRIWIGLPEGDVIKVRRTALQFLSWGVIFSTIFMLLIGLLFGGHALRGLSHAAQKAGQIRPTSKELLELPSRQDELYQLVFAINGLLQRIWDQKDFENRFMGQVAHELGAPLTSIQGFIKRAQDKNDQSAHPLPGLTHDLEQARKVATELLFISQDLMQLARGRSEITLALHLLSAHAIRERLERLVPNVDYSGHWNTYVLCDPDRLVQALRNLLANARRAATDMGWVQLHLDTTPEMVVFYVRDNGPGLPKGAERKIFEAFYSRSNSSGLGLSVANQIVELHGGTLSAHNLAHGGAEFILSIPQAFDDSDL